MLLAQRSGGLMHRPTWMLVLLLAVAACPAQKQTRRATSSPSPTISNVGPVPPISRERKDPCTPHCRESAAHSWLWGVTIDNVWSVDATVDALQVLPVRATARVVFDEPMPAVSYREPVSRVHQV